MSSKQYSFIKKSFEKLDSFGIGYNFMIDGNDKYKTLTGGCLTLSFGFIIIGLFMGFGVDLYKREKPKVSFNTEVGAYTKNKLSNNNFTFAYRIEDYLGNYFIDERAINLQVNIWHAVQNETGVWNVESLQSIPIQKCSEFSWMKEKEQEYNITLAGWNCMNFTNFTMGGNYDGNFVYAFRIDISQCVNSTANNNDCKTNEEIKALFDNAEKSLFYSYLYMDAIPALDNFEKPLTTSLVNHYETLSIYTTKRNIQTYKKVTVNNDVGWFFRDIEIIEVVANDDISTDFSVKDEFLQPWLFTHLCYFGKRIETYNRSYTKIQEVFAAIGGFAKFFHVAISLIYTWYSRINKNLNILDRIYQNDEIDKIGEEKTVGIKLNNFIANETKLDNLPDQSVSKIFHNKTTENKISRLDTIINKSPSQENYPGKLNIKSSSSLYLFKFCKCCMRKSSQRMLEVQYKIYEEEKKSIYSLFDTVNFIKFQKDYDNFKKIILTDKQILMLSLIKISSLSQCHQNKYTSNNIKNYFQQLQMFESDLNCRKALDLMDVERKEKVIKFLTNK